MKGLGTGPSRGLRTHRNSSPPRTGLPCTSLWCLPHCPQRCSGSAVCRLLGHAVHACPQEALLRSCLPGWWRFVFSGRSEHVRQRVSALGSALLETWNAVIPKRDGSEFGFATFSWTPCLLVAFVLAHERAQSLRRLGRRLFSPLGSRLAVGRRLRRGPVRGSWEPSPCVFGDLGYRGLQHCPR